MRENPIEMMELFMDAFGVPETMDIDERMWLLYEAALNSELSDDWDQNTRPDMFLFIRLATDFFKGFIQIYGELKPLLKNIVIKNNPV